MAGCRLIELAGAARARRLAQAANVEVIRKRKTREIVEIHLLDHGDDSRKKEVWTDPRKLSIDAATDENPAGVWCLKPLKLVGSGRGNSSGEVVPRSGKLIGVVLPRGDQGLPCSGSAGTRTAPIVR